MSTHLNLMTDEDRRQQLLRGARRSWTRILLGTAVVLAMCGTVQWWHGTATSEELQSLEDRYAPIQTLKNQCIRMRTEINTMREAQQLTLRLVDTRPAVTLLGAISKAAANAGGRVFVDRLELQTDRASGDQRVAVVSGYGNDNSAIAKFTEALRASSLFADVSLNSSASQTASNQQARSFQIECQL